MCTTGGTIIRCGTGSPLARTWDTFQLRPYSWYPGSHHIASIDCSDGSFDYWIVTAALSKAQKHISSSGTCESDFESVYLSPFAFDTESAASRSYRDYGYQIYSGLKTLKLWLASYHGAPSLERYSNQHGMHMLLQNLPSLTHLELHLPYDRVGDDDDDDDEERPLSWWPYNSIFLKMGLWPQLTRFFIRNISINISDLVCLLILRMPHLRHLELGDIELLDGCWEGVFEFLRVADSLSSLKVVHYLVLLHRDKESYYEHSLGHEMNSLPELLHDYVVNWPHHPARKHPSLGPDEPAENSLDFLT